jgi:hypothetical protein
MNRIGIFLIGIIIVSCNKREFISKPEIQIDFNNDVSPTLITFSVEDNYDRYKWKFNDYYFDPPFTNVMTRTHSGQDTVTIYLEVFRDEQSCQVQKTFITPPRPEKMFIKGVEILRINESNLIPDRYKLMYSIYDYNSRTYDSTFFILADDIEQNDIIYFEKEIEFDFTKFSRDSLPEIGISIFSLNPKYLFSYSTESKGIFLLPDPYFPKTLQVTPRELSNSDYFRFETDWIPEKK